MSPLRRWAAVILVAAPAAGTPAAGDDAVVVGHSAPEKRDVEALLGVYAAGRETLALRWQDGLVLDLDRISVPVDGRWHETVPTFAVRHRAGWRALRRALTLEEQHDRGAHWRYELRFGDGWLDKILPAGESGEEETLVRRYRRRP